MFSSFHEHLSLRKGTVCDGLKKRYGLVHISPGQILRDEVCKQSELGLKAREYSANCSDLLPCFSRTMHVFNTFLHLSARYKRVVNLLYD